MKLIYSLERSIDHRATGAEIRGKRKRSGLSLRAVARKLKLSAPYLSDLERGNRNWTEERFEAVARILA